MKLELKHLAPYLPYKIKVTNYDKPLNARLVDLIAGKPYEQYKPILRPLSDLTKEIEVNGEKFVPIYFFELGDDFNESVDYGKGNIKLIGLLKDMAKFNFIDIDYMQYGVLNKLFEWHFDVFGLIKNNLAIDINTLNK